MCQPVSIMLQSLPVSCKPVIKPCDTGRTLYQPILPPCEPIITPCEPLCKPVCKPVCKPCIPVPKPPNPCDLFDLSLPPCARRRNGMDCETEFPVAKDVRDWQMSPFGRERFDLDEIQRAEKLGVKGRHELARLRKLYNMEPPCPEPLPKPPCDECTKRKEEANRKNIKCSSKLIYQPFGPTVVYATSYSRPEYPKPRFYSYLDPTPFSNQKYTVLGPELPPTSSCMDYEEFPARNFKHVYRPYGPYGEMRLTPNLYVPLGPKIYCPDDCN